MSDQTKQLKTKPNSSKRICTLMPIIILTYIATLDMRVVYFAGQVLN